MQNNQISQLKDQNFWISTLGKNVSADREGKDQDQRSSSLSHGWYDGRWGIRILKLVTLRVASELMSVRKQSAIYSDLIRKHVECTLSNAFVDMVRVVALLLCSYLPQTISPRFTWFRGQSRHQVIKISLEWYRSRCRRQRVARYTQGISVEQLKGGEDNVCTCHWSGTFVWRGSGSFVVARRCHGLALRIFFLEDIRCKLESARI